MRGIQQGDKRNKPLKQKAGGRKSSITASGAKCVSPETDRDERMRDERERRVR